MVRSRTVPLCLLLSRHLNPQIFQNLSTKLVFRSWKWESLCPMWFQEHSEGEGLLQLRFWLPSFRREPEQTTHGTCVKANCEHLLSSPFRYPKIVERATLSTPRLDLEGDRTGWYTSWKGLQSLPNFEPSLLMVKNPFTRPTSHELKIPHSPSNDPSTTKILEGALSIPHSPSNYPSTTKILEGALSTGHVAFWALLCSDPAAGSAAAHQSRR